MDAAVLYAVCIKRRCLAVTAAMLCNGQALDSLPEERSQAGSAAESAGPATSIVTAGPTTAAAHQSCPQAAAPGMPLIGGHQHMMSHALRMGLAMPRCRLPDYGAAGLQLWIHINLYTID